MAATAWRGVLGNATETSRADVGWQWGGSGESGTERGDEVGEVVEEVGEVGEEEGERERGRESERNEEAVQSVQELWED